MESQPHLHIEIPKKKSTPIHLWKSEAKKLGQTKARDAKSKEAILKALGVNSKEFKGSLKDLLKVLKKRNEEIKEKKKRQQKKIVMRKRQMERRIDPNDGKPRTLSEFTMFYRSTEEWEVAEKEVRVDPNDGVGRTKVRTHSYCERILALFLTLFSTVRIQRKLHD